MNLNHMITQGPPGGQSPPPGPRWLLAVLPVVVLLSRLPFLEPGYGLHADAWIVAIAGQEIHRTGEYHPSRFPGYPLQEYAVSHLVSHGPPAVNGATAVFSAAAALFLALLMRALGGRHWFLGPLAFALTPIVYNNSTLALDYLWAMAFVLAGLYAGVRRWYLLAGVLLGLAAGCRLTSVVMLAALWLLIIPPEDRRGLIRGWLVSGLAAAAVGLACYWPLLSRYGRGFLRYYNEAAYPSIPELAKSMTVGVLGWLGLAAVVLGLAGHVLRRVHRKRGGTAAPLAAVNNRHDQDHGRGKESATVPPRQRVPAGSPWIAAAWLVPSGLYLLAYLLMPIKIDYLIPIVPLALLLLERRLRGWAFAAICVGLILSPFVGYPTWEAPIRWDHLKRQDQAAFLQDVLRRAGQTRQKILVLSGRADLILLHVAQTSLWPQPACSYEPDLTWSEGSPVVLRMDLRPRSAGPDCLVRIAYLPDAAAIRELAAQGFRVTYLPSAGEWYPKKIGIDWREFGASGFCAR